MKVDSSALKRLARYLRKAHADAYKQVKKVHKDTAKQVAKVGKAKGRSMGSVFGKSARAIRAGTSGVASVVYLGGAAWPYAIGAEQGSKQGPRKKQFDPWRGQPGPDPFTGSAGYFLQPAARENAGEIKAGWVRDMDSWLEDNFPAVI